MFSTMLTPREKYAILIGINWYSPKDGDNLEGCVNDVKKIKDMLITTLHVPEDNITVLTADTAPVGDDMSQPTKTNVMTAIQNVDAKPGALLYIHYSGHGDRVPTKYYPELKSRTAKDEVLCTLEEDITDVEFGNLLDKLAEKKKLVVCAVVDCCFSGGVTRHRADGAEEQRRVRCRSWKSVEVSAIGRRSRGSVTGRGSRNSVPKESWFYRPRGYNVVAAAQPHEKAREYRGDDGKIYGRMTYHLEQSLMELQSWTEPVTYGHLQNVLEAKCKAASKRTGKRQQPMHLGVRTRAVFGAVSPDIGQRNLIANVIGLTEDEQRVTLNKGSAFSIGEGDKFRLYGPSNSFFGRLVADVSHLPVEVVVDKVEGLRSEAVVKDKGLHGIRIGWFAELSERAKRAKVGIHIPPGLPLAIELKQNWQSYVDSQFPIDLHFKSTPEDVDIFVEGDGESVFRFQDGNGSEMLHVPPLRADCPQNGKKLMELLKHLCSYQLVANLSHSDSDDLDLPEYEFDIKRLPQNKKAKDALSAWRVSFKNKESIFLYLTILNLTPAYGVHQIFPSHTQFASSAAVDRDAKIPKLDMDIVVPDLLKQAAKSPNFLMKDTFKAFVTTEQVNFFNYLLPDLTGQESRQESAPIESVDKSRTIDKDKSDDSGDDDSDTSKEDNSDGSKRRLGRVKESREFASWFVDEKLIQTSAESEREA